MNLLSDFNPSSSEEQRAAVPGLHLGQRPLIAINPRMHEFYTVVHVQSRD